MQQGDAASSTEVVGMALKETKEALLLMWHVHLYEYLYYFVPVCY